MGMTEAFIQYNAHVDVKTVFSINRVLSVIPVDLRKIDLCK